MSLRSISLALATIAFAGAPLLGWWLMHRDSEAMAARGFVCGNPLIGDAMIAMFLAALLSLLASVLGAIAFRRLPAPRPRRRAFELLGVGLPLLMALGLLAAAMLGRF